MTEGWKLDDFNMTQEEVAREMSISQQNVNDAQKHALRKAKEAFLRFYTLEEIRSYIIYCERR